MSEPQPRREERSQKNGGGLIRTLTSVLGTPPSGKFGTFAGVFTPSILTILGVIMFLRFPWVVGHAGLGGALLIVLIAHLITIPTAFSVAAIATNRTVRAGGDYYMLSRSLGPEIGGAIGIARFFAQALSVTLYVLGFSEALVSSFPYLPFRIVCIVTTLAVAGLAFWDTSLALKSQFIILVLIALSLVSVFAGGGGEARPEQVTWWREAVAGQRPESFATVFAVFFPAVTGFTQGVTMSGDLRDPRRSIPVGTFAAVGVGLVIYIALIVYLGFEVDPEVARDPSTLVFEKLARYGTLVTLGILGASLSSAMGSILGAPRILQALAKDRVVPRFLARGHGPTNLPRIATLVSLAVALSGFILAFTSRSGLNAIASVITMFFLASYGFLNLASGLARWSKTPSFRPTLRVPAIVSLAGAGGCFYLMSLINLPAMVAAVVVMSLIYVGLERKHLRKTWGDMRHGIWAALIRKGLFSLRDVQYHPINWQPHVVVMGGSPTARRYLLDIGHWIGGGRGVVTYYFMMRGSVDEMAERIAPTERTLQEHIDGIYPTVLARAHACEDIYTGIFDVASAHGLPGFDANSIVMGWSEDPDRPDGLARLIRRLSTLDKSLLLVAQNEDKGFGQKKTIDIWWGGLESNGGLMLLLAAMLTDEGEWQSAAVRVKMIVDESAPLSLTRRNLERIIAEARLDAEAHIIARQPADRPVSEIIRERSDGDLVLLGLRPPDPEEAGSEFVARIDELIQSLPTSILVKASSEFKGAQMLFEEEWSPPPKKKKKKKKKRDAQRPGHRSD